MFELEHGHIQPASTPGGEVREPGSLYIADVAEQPETDKTSVQASTTDVKVFSAQARDQRGTIEHLAARKSIVALNLEDPQLKQRLGSLRIEVTRLLTSLRWENQPVNEVAEEMMPLLNIGPVPQWKDVLVPLILETDRSGKLVPVWQKIIETTTVQATPSGTNPAETATGRPCRYAILMLGNYKTGTHSEKTSLIGFSRQSDSKDLTRPTDGIKLLQKLALDPDTSLYASQSLAKIGTLAAMQTLIATLKDAKGWAKVDAIEASLSLEQPQFYDLIIASGLSEAQGLESYIAIPIYRTIPLGDYLRPNQNNPRLAQQAALIFGQLLQEAMVSLSTNVKARPIVFERDLPALSRTLFEGARTQPNWQNVLAIHRLGHLLGRYWSEIARGSVTDAKILEPLYACFPMMPEIERWMAGPGRDVLLAELSHPQGEGFIPSIKILGELRDPRAISPLIAYLEGAQTLTNSEEARSLSTTCDTLGSLGDRRAVEPILQLLQRVVEVGRRSNQPRRPDNLPQGDSDILGSILYAAAIRACGRLGDKNALDAVLQATNDLDPYVRAQAYEALKHIDPTGENPQSLRAVHEAFEDPNESILRIAFDLTLQYKDSEAQSLLQHIIDTRPNMASAAYDIQRRLR